jgi:signal transduction histidine kinase
VGPASAIIPVAAIGYALLRRDLWNFKLIVSEFFVFGIILLLLFDIFLNTTQTSIFIFKFITLGLTVIFGYFLIKGIFNEFESRERIKHFTDQFAVANKRLQEIDNEKSDFVSIASHQLRTPLTVIKGYASMLLEGTFGPIEEVKHKEIIQKIYDASERLVKMINDFLDISRIEAGEMSYTFEKVDIEKLVEEVIGEFQATVEGSAIPILIKGTGTPLFINGDSLKIRQVLANLLDNAIKYSYKNNRITITVRKEDDKAVLSFSDAGIGIPLEKRSNLFKKYSRVVPDEKLHREGRGLGLYIARQIILAHNGSIWVESEGTGRGSTFFILFPLFREGSRSSVAMRPLVTDIKQPV